MSNLPVLKKQEVINDVRKHPRLDGVFEVVCESGNVYNTKAPQNYKVGNAIEISYVEIRKPKQNGGEWVNLWTNEPREYRPSARTYARIGAVNAASDKKFNELMSAINEISNEISAQIVGLEAKVDGIAEDLQRRP